MRDPRTLVAALLALLAFPAARAAQPAPVVGTWDLTWETRRGPKPSGQLVIRQDGEGPRLAAVLRDQGTVDARGALAGDTLTLTGRKLGATFVIRATRDGERLAGTLRVLTVGRRFTAVRRP